MSLVPRFAAWVGRTRHRRAALGAALAAAAVAAAAVVALLGSGGGEATAALQRRAREAARAYGEGRPGEAARLYEELIGGGHASAEVFYNLGNAYLRDGRPGPAVLNYRKAWRLAPRDPDVDANLRAALQASGAAEADLSSAEIALTRLSEREWAAAAALAWWAVCLSLALALLAPRRRWACVRAAAAAAAVLALAACGLWTWRGFERDPEVVILGERQNALSAPLASSSPRFSLPEGSIVRSRGRQGEWVRVTHGQLAGWIRRAACAPVLLEAATPRPASSS